jgi:hypothetical protein
MDRGGPGAELGRACLRDGSNHSRAQHSTQIALWFYEMGYIHSIGEENNPSASARDSATGSKVRRRPWLAGVRSLAWCPCQDTM